jgi:SAM-dependent methyltransferase
MTSHAADLLRVRHDDPHYQDLARAEAEFWAKPHPFGLESIERNPVDDPINLWMNARFTGDPRTPWEATVSRHGPFRRGLILGTSALNVEACILETNPTLHVTFMDISAGALARRQEILGARFPGRVATETMDANFLDLPPDTFDCIASSASIHHVTNLEYLAYQLNRSLTDEGWFFLQDYVGEPQFQFDSGKRLVVEALLRDATPVERRCEMCWKDTSDLSPFCGLRSNEILPVLRQHLAEQSVRTAGALSVALMRYTRRDPTPLPEPSAPVRAWRALDDTLRRFRGLPPRARLYIPAALLDDLLRVGDILADAGVIAPGNAFAIYRKRKLVGTLRTPNDSGP